MFWLIVSACAIIGGAWVLSVMYEMAGNPDKWIEDPYEGGEDGR